MTKPTTPQAAIQASSMQASLERRIEQRRGRGVEAHEGDGQDDPEGAAEQADEPQHGTRTLPEAGGRRPVTQRYRWPRAPARVTAAASRTRLTSRPSAAACLALRPGSSGTRARRKPSRAASRSRRSRPGTGRTSPSSDTSPQASSVAGDGAVALGGRDRQSQWQVQGRLADGDAAGETGVDIAAADIHPAAPGQHGDEQHEAVDVETGDRAPGRSEAGRRHQRLHLDQQRATALEDGRHRHAWR